jgi:hypothetical protein
MGNSELERDDVFAIEREVIREANMFRGAGAHQTPGTVTQGYLSGRWQRRDGNVYAAAGSREIPGPNSPIAGGESA